MTNTPILSICVPSRNRQYYFQKTIEGLLRNKRDDVQFVFADNSDDPSIMNDFMAEIVKDPRVVYLPSTDAVLPMIGNWERSIRATTGQWVTFIGDDDFIEVDVASLIKRVVAAEPELEAFAWGLSSYLWPEEGKPATAVSVGIDYAITKVPRAEAMKRMFGWFDARVVPTSGFSIYHAAISRSLLETIRETYGVYFENPNVDYDMAMKVIFHGRTFATCLRQFSTMGICPLSNSYSIGRLEDTKKKIKIFIDELGGNFENDPVLKDFPFNSYLGVTASIATTQYWYKEKYGLRYGGWEKGFAEACARNTESYAEPDAFETVKAGYEAAFRKWQGGKFLKYYKPTRVSREGASDLAVTGFHADGVYVRSDMAGASTPAEMWDLITSMVIPVDQIPVPDQGLPMPWEIKKFSLANDSAPDFSKMTAKELKKLGVITKKM